MKRLDILGNDALEMLSYKALAKFHLLAALESLTLHSTYGNDLSNVPADLPGTFFLGLVGLKKLQITLGATTVASLRKASHGQPFLHTHLPPNLEVLYFRGPVSMVPDLDVFAAAFADHTFLPALQRISLVLDLPEKGRYGKMKDEVPLVQLNRAKEACTKLLQAAVDARSALVKEFQEPWSDVHSFLIEKVVSRWAEM